MLIGKTMTTTELGEGAKRTLKRDKSIVIKHGDGSVVDAILRSKNSDCTGILKCRLRTTRQPIVGDKVSSRMGQKGVIGLTLDHSDMPFTEDGQVPDIIVNPHAIPR